MGVLDTREGTLMLFRKDMEPRCAYCQHGTDIGDGTVACLKKGVSDSGSHCGSFRYDPFKRTPPHPAEPDFSKLRDEDFSLE